MNFPVLREFKRTSVSHWLSFCFRSYFRLAAELIEYYVLSILWSYCFVRLYPVLWPSVDISCSKSLLFVDCLSIRSSMDLIL